MGLRSNLRYTFDKASLGRLGDYSLRIKKERRKGQLDQRVCTQLLLCNADFMARYLSTVTSDEIRSAYFVIELLCLREHSWELSYNSNNGMSLSVAKIDDLLSVVLC